MTVQFSEFSLQNVKCAGCVGKIQNKLNKLDGIKLANVNLLEKTLRVEYSSQKLDESVIKAVSELGYGASLTEIKTKSTSLLISTALPIIFGLILMIYGMKPVVVNQYGVFISIITLLVITYTGNSILRSGLNGFRHLNFNMHSLITLGVGSAWLYSTLIVIWHTFGHMPITHVYFESALIIIGLINLGAYFEDKARHDTTKAIKALAQLQPNETTIVVDDKEQIIQTNLLKTEYIVKIRPGDRIPADGVIIEGDGLINESMLTGEPLPRHKKINDNVIAGTLNTNGMFLFRITGIGGNTLLAEIIELVKSAQMSKPPLANIADSVAYVFVPSIILIAAISSIFWWFLGPEPHYFYAISVFMTVLIIACPCSVGLAIPVALMVGLCKSATKGILIRNAACLSVTDKLNYILLDKTGTITTGEPNIVNFETIDNNHSDEYIRIMKSMESNSTHPLAKSIMAFKPEISEFPKCTNFSIDNGSGIEATINNTIYYLGSEQWVFGKVKVTNNLNNDNHFTQVFLANETEILARVDISDTIKPDSAKAIKKLSQMGMKIAMVTGDNFNNANYVAKQVGIDKVYAECKPQDKIDLVKQLQSQKYIVLFVGDGINDAPSLTSADIGIAIGGGTDIAIASADITLMSGSLGSVEDAIIIGKAINKNMKQNLFGSFIYNILAVVIATGAFYPVLHVLLNPIIASIAMSMSSITVILNALRLRNI